MRHPFRWLGLGLCILGTAVVAQARDGHPFRPEICIADLRAHIEVLAADDMKGRESLSPEGRRAADYIANHFQRAGLTPKGTQGFLQPYAIKQAVLGSENLLVTQAGGTTTSWTVEKDWNPFSVSPNADVSGEVVFAGYGIEAPDRSWNDFAGVSVKDRIVLVMRKNPGWREQRHAAFTAKLSAAVKHGAKAILLVNNPATTARTGEDRIGHWSAGLGAPGGSGKIPYAFISQEMAAALLAAGGQPDLEALEAALRKDGPRSALLEGVDVRLRTDLGHTEEANTANVVGFLPGTDPELSEEVIVLGGHYDHVGLGLYGSTGGAQASGQIHNGADDNGSGTAVLLELAAWFGQPTRRPARSLLFIAFSGEERGLLGSRHFVEHPTVPLADMVAMINMDMVGRCKEGQCQVGGVGTAKGLQALVAAHNTETVLGGTPLRLSWDPQGTAPSDSTSFFRKRIPVLFFFTGLHEDYHRPTDDIERIAWEPMLRIARLVEGVTRDMAMREDRLVFTMPPRPPRPPVVGIRPSPEPHAQGIAILTVTANGPAASAGVEAGDVLVELAGNPVKDLGALRRVLRRLEAGKRVKAVLLRGDERISVQITLGGRPARRGR